MSALLILPAKDEAENLPPLLASIEDVRRNAGLSLDVLVIDDGSLDGTAAVTEDLSRLFPYVRLLRHPRNLGLGAAVQSGLTYAAAERYDVAILMDADLSQDPADLPRLLAAIHAGADLVVGSRYAPGGAMEGVPGWRVVISVAGNAVGRLVLGIPIRDATSGYRAFRVAAVAGLHLKESGYGVQLEAVVKAKLAGLRLAETPITLRVRRHGASKLLYNGAFWRRYIALFIRAWRWTR